MHRTARHPHLTSRRLGLIGLLAGGLLAIGSVASATPSGDGPGNSANAHACKQGGWQDMYTAEGESFENQGDCVSYGAHGGTYNPDVDDDGVVNGEDNCPTTPNPDQLDLDENGVGDACQIEEFFSELG